MEGPYTSPVRFFSDTGSAVYFAGSVEVSGSSFINNGEGDAIEGGFVEGADADNDFAPEDHEPEEWSD